MITDEQVIAVCRAYYGEDSTTNYEQYELIDMRRALEAYEASKWVNVEKDNTSTYPSHDTNVLCVLKDGYMDVCNFDHVLKQFYQADYSTAKVVSWQPLPKFKE